MLSFSMDKGPRSSTCKIIFKENTYMLGATETCRNIDINRNIQDKQHPEAASKKRKKEAEAAQRSEVKSR